MNKQKSQKVNKS